MFWFLFGLTIILFFYPGTWIQDSVDSLAQALSVTPLNDWHPVWFALLMRPFVVLGPAVFFVFQSIYICLCYWFSSKNLVAVFQLDKRLEKYVYFLLLFVPPGLSLNISVVKDNIYIASYVLLLSWLFSKKIWSLSSYKSWIVIIIALIGSAMRHNGFLFFSITLALVLTVFKEKRNLNNFIFALLICTLTTSLYLTPKLVLPESQQFEGKLSIKDWIIRADSIGLYVHSTGSSAQIERMNRVVSLKKFNKGSNDTYLYAWGPLPLKPPYSIQYVKAELKEVLFLQPWNWLKEKIVYLGLLLREPPIHGRILSGDPTNTSFIHDANSFGINGDQFYVSGSRGNVLKKLYSFFGGTSWDEPLPFFDRFKSLIWRYDVWMVILSISIPLSRKSIHKKVLTSLLAISLINFLILGLLSMNNQARYFFISYIFGKFALLYISSLVFKKF